MHEPADDEANGLERYVGDVHFLEYKRLETTKDQ